MKNYSCKCIFNVTSRKASVVFKLGSSETQKSVSVEESITNKNNRVLNFPVLIY